MFVENARKLFDDLGQLIESRREGDSSWQSLFQAKLRELGLVTREEFDAQQAVLIKTRAKLESLEADLATLQQAVDSQSS